MARTLDPEIHAGKRDAFVDAAQRYIASGGYEQLSIQQLIDDVGASKGAFYHYFGSKGDLLEAVVERMADQAEAAWQPILTAPGLSAGRRLEGVFRTVAAVKAERRDVVMAILHAWLSDDNAIVREKLRRLVADRMTPLLIGLVRQGVAEGDFTATDPDATAQVLVAVIQGSQELALKQFVGCQSGELTVDDVIRAFASYTEAVERILGTPPGSLVLVDPDMLRTWFT
ncbi:MAG: TetR/AcrR family transcriptional regulator [Chloroflexota bacterium]